MRARVSGLAITAVLSLAVLAIGHDLAFLLTYGSEYGAAMARTGHDGRWDETVRVVLAVSAALLAAGTARLVWLYRLFTMSKSAGLAVELSLSAYVRIFVPLWFRIFVAALALFVLQENYERLSVGLPLPGLGVLGSTELADPVPVFFLISLLVAALGALFSWGIAALEAFIQSRRQSRGYLPTACPTRSGDPVRLGSSLIGRNLAGRAPPLALPA